MATYNIDDHDGKQLRGGIKDSGAARKEAQHLANKSGRTVYLYAPSEVRFAKSRGETHQKEAIRPLACNCDDVGAVQCETHGPRE